MPPLGTHEELERAIRSEVQTWRKRLRVRGPVPPECIVNGNILCPMCPWCEFARKETLADHIDRVHWEKKDEPCSTKQWRLACGLFNERSLQSRARTIFDGTDLGAIPDTRYLHRSALLLRQHLTSSPSWDENCTPATIANDKLDKCVRLLLDNGNTRCLER